jgi:hypothetical protein
VGTNNVAPEHYLVHADAPAAALIIAALSCSWRLEPPTDDEARLLGRELLELYIHHIDDHITRLDAIKQHRSWTMCLLLRI